MLSVWMMLLCNAMVFSLRVGLPAGSFPRPLSREEELDHLQRAAEGDLDARNKLVEHNLRLVAHMVKNIWSKRREWKAGV